MIYGLFIELESIPLKVEVSFLQSLVELHGMHNTDRLLKLDSDFCFYVGRTTDFSKREKEHRKAEGNERKYQLIRLMDSLGIKWHMGHLKGHVCEETALLEMERRGHPCVNDKRGDLNMDRMNEISDANIAAMQEKRSVMTPENDRRRALLRERMAKLSK